MDWKDGLTAAAIVGLGYWGLTKVVKGPIYEAEYIMVKCDSCGKEKKKASDEGGHQLSRISAFPSKRPAKGFRYCFRCDEHICDSCRADGHKHFDRTGCESHDMISQKLSRKWKKEIAERKAKKNAETFDAERWKPKPQCEGCGAVEGGNIEGCDDCNFTYWFNGKVYHPDSMIHIGAESFSADTHPPITGYGDSGDNLPLIISIDTSGSTSWDSRGKRPHTILDTYKQIALDAIVKFDPAWVTIYDHNKQVKIVYDGPDVHGEARNVIKNLRSGGGTASLGDVIELLYNKTGNKLILTDGEWMKLDWALEVLPKEWKQAESFEAETYQKTLWAKGDMRIVADYDHDFWDGDIEGWGWESDEEYEQFVNHVWEQGVYILRLEKWNPEVGVGWDSVDSVHGNVPSDTHSLIDIAREQFSEFGDFKE